MNLKQYILVLAVGTIIACSAWVLVIFSIDPATAGFLAFLAFYLTLFIALNGLFTTSATIFRSIFFSKRRVEDVVTTSLRQGLILSIMLIGSLILLSYNLLTWWTLILLVISLALVEFLFISLKSKRE